MIKTTSYKNFSLVIHLAQNKLIKMEINEEN